MTSKDFFTAKHGVFLHKIRKTFVFAGEKHKRISGCLNGYSRSAHGLSIFAGEGDLLFSTVSGYCESNTAHFFSLIYSDSIRNAVGESFLLFHVLLWHIVHLKCYFISFIGHSYVNRPINLPKPYSFYLFCIPIAMLPSFKCFRFKYDVVDHIFTIKP